MKASALLLEAYRALCQLERVDEEQLVELAALGRLISSRVVDLAVRSTKGRSMEWLARVNVRIGSAAHRTRQEVAA